MTPIPNTTNTRWHGKILHIYEGVYGLHLYFVDAKNSQEYCETIAKQLKIKLEYNHSQTDGGGFQTVEYHDEVYGFFWCPKSDVGALVHECFHAVHWALSSRGMTLSDDSEEAYAYLLQFLIETISKKAK